MKDNYGDYPMGEKPGGRFWLRREREDHRREVEILRNRIAGIASGKIISSCSERDHLRFELGATMSVLDLKGNSLAFENERDGDAEQVRRILRRLQEMKQGNKKSEGAESGEGHVS